jgi:hypothetical protein
MAAEAIRYAVEDLRTPKALGACLQVGDEGFTSAEIQRLYEPPTFHYTRLSDRAACVRTETDGALLAAKSQEKGPPPPGFQNGGETATAPYDLGARGALDVAVTPSRGLAGPNVYTVLEKFAPTRRRSRGGALTKANEYCPQRKMLLKAACAGKLIGAAFRTGHYDETMAHHARYGVEATHPHG